MTVKFYGYACQGTGELMEELEVSPGTNVKTVIDIFTRNHQIPWAVKSTSATPTDPQNAYAVMVNGISIEKSKHSTATVRGGDRITIFLPIGGG